MSKFFSKRTSFLGGSTTPWSWDTLAKGKAPDPDKPDSDDDSDIQIIDPPPNFRKVPVTPDARQPSRIKREERDDDDNIMVNTASKTSEKVTQAPTKRRFGSIEDVESPTKRARGPEKTAELKIEAMSDISDEIAVAQKRPLAATVGSRSKDIFLEDPDESDANEEVEMPATPTVPVKAPMSAVAMKAAQREAQRLHSERLRSNAITNRSESTPRTPEAVAKRADSPISISSSSSSSAARPRTARLADEPQNIVHVATPEPKVSEQTMETSTERTPSTQAALDAQLSGEQDQDDQIMRDIEANLAAEAEQRRKEQEDLDFARQSHILAQEMAAKRRQEEREVEKAKQEAKKQQEIERRRARREAELKLKTEKALKQKKMIWDAVMSNSKKPENQSAFKEADGVFKTLPATTERVFSHNAARPTIPDEKPRLDANEANLSREQRVQQMKERNARNKEDAASNNGEHLDESTAAAMDTPVLADESEMEERRQRGLKLLMQQEQQRRPRTTFEPLPTAKFNAPKPTVPRPRQNYGGREDPFGPLPPINSAESGPVSLNSLAGQAAIAKINRPLTPVHRGGGGGQSGRPNMRQLNEITASDLQLVRWYDDGLDGAMIVAQYETFTGKQRSEDTLRRRYLLVRKAVSSLDQRLLDMATSGDGTALAEVNEAVFATSRSPARPRERSPVFSALTSAENPVEEGFGGSEGRPTTGGKTINEALMKLYFDAAVNVEPDQEEEAEDDDGYEDDQDNLSYIVYQVQRREITREQMNEGMEIDEAYWHDVGRGYTTQARAREEMARQAYLSADLKTREAFATACTLDTSPDDDDGTPIFTHKTKHAGVVQVRLDIRLAMFEPSRRAQIDAYCVPKVIYFVKQTTTKYFKSGNITPSPEDAELFGEPAAVTGHSKVVIDFVSDEMYGVRDLANERAIKHFVAETFTSATTHMDSRAWEQSNEEKTLAAELALEGPKALFKKAGVKRDVEIQVEVEKRMVKGPRNF